MLQSFWIGTDFARLMSSLPAANEAVKALMENQMANVKALDEANQHAIEAFHALFNRQNEILHSALDDVARLAMNGTPGPDAFARQAAITLEATRRTLDNLRQTSEAMAQASQRATQALTASMRAPQQ